MIQTYVLSRPYDNTEYYYIIVTETSACENYYFSIKFNVLMYTCDCCLITLLHVKLKQENVHVLFKWNIPNSLALCIMNKKINEQKGNHGNHDTFFHSSVLSNKKNHSKFELFVLASLLLFYLNRILQYINLKLFHNPDYIPVLLEHFNCYRKDNRRSASSSNSLRNQTIYM